MNSITIKGRISQDIEIKQTQSGKSVTNFSVAVNRRFDKDTADFFRCTAWEKTAEFLGKYFTKGQEILLQGEMQLRQYTDKNGNNATAWEIKVDNVEFCGSKGEKSAPKREAGTPPVASSEAIGDDEYPF